MSCKPGTKLGTKSSVTRTNLEPKVIYPKNNLNQLLKTPMEGNITDVRFVKLLTRRTIGAVGVRSILHQLVEPKEVP